MTITYKYRSIINAHLYGDHSYDDLRILSHVRHSNTYHIYSPLFINPAISPRKYSNPAVRLYHINNQPNNYELVDYTQYYIPLHTYTNKRQNTQWYKQYVFTNEYNLKGLSIHSIAELYKRIQYNEQLRSKYMNNILVRQSLQHTLRNDISILCDMISMNNVSNARCRDTGRLPQVVIHD